VASVFYCNPQNKQELFSQKHKLIALKIHGSLSEVEIFISLIYKLDKFLHSTGCVIA
jgi:hypothetical protein